MVTKGSPIAIKICVMISVAINIGNILITTFPSLILIGLKRTNIVNTILRARSTWDKSGKLNKTPITKRADKKILAKLKDCWLSIRVPLVTNNKVVSTIIIELNRIVDGAKSRNRSSRIRIYSPKLNRIIKIYY